MTAMEQASSSAVPDAWRHGEIAVIGVARSGVAAARWLLRHGLAVYASDAGDSPELRERAAPLRAAGAAVDLGRHDLDRIRRASLVVVSPGVPPDAAPVAAARAAGVPIRAELDLGARALPECRFIVITGTNGKTTTTALTAHLLDRAHLSAVAAGNIGRPLVELALVSERPRWVVVEASSFQLHDAPDLDPDIGAVTNLSPNHLDRYTSVDAYYADKRLLFRNARPDATWVLNGDDEAVLALAEGVAGRRRMWRMHAPADAWYDADGARLMLEERPLLARDELPLVGLHNVANALAAALCAETAGASIEAIAGGLRTAPALPHRLEIVRDVRDVRWINDSKATSVAATATAIRAMDRPFVLLLGGRHKGEPYTSLVPLLAARCRGVIAFGESAPIVARDLDVVGVTRVPSLLEAVDAAARLARPGDAVLLSPACSSYDQFTDYEERGATFRRLVAAL